MTPPTEIEIAAQVQNYEKALQQNTPYELRQILVANTDKITVFEDGSIDVLVNRLGLQKRPTKYTYRPKKMSESALNQRLR